MGGTLSPAVSSFSSSPCSRSARDSKPHERRAQFGVPTTHRPGSTRARRLLGHRDLIACEFAVALMFQRASNHALREGVLDSVAAVLTIRLATDIRQTIKLRAKDVRGGQALSESSKPLGRFHISVRLDAGDVDARRLRDNRVAAGRALPIQVGVDGRSLEPSAGSRRQ